MKLFKSLLLAGFSVLLTVYAYAQPANDNCNTATNLGSLPAPAACPSGVGNTVSVAGTIVAATPANPYIYQNNCSGAGGPNMGVPANDVWYSFVATSYQCVINITGATFANPNVAMYAGNCGNLGGGVGGCAVGTGGTVTLTVEQMVIGTTYYIQVSGNTGQSGTFNMTVRNNRDCADCLVGSTLTASPLPVNGSYQPGQTVTFCYHVTQYAQVNTNWLHGVQVTLGSGWNAATITPTTTPPPCQGTGQWLWLPSCTSTATGQTFGLGWYFDTTDGGTNPGNNFGDNCSGAITAANWNFCFSVQTAAACNPGSNLSVTINTSGDGESGSWSSLGCTDDPPSIFNAVGACCPPNMTSTPTSCPGASDGTATATPVGSAGPYDYVWTNSSSVVVSTTNNAPGANTATGLPAGTYTVTVTDNNNCATTATVTVTNGAAIATPTAGSNSPVCAGGTLNLTAANVAGATYSWTGPNGFTSNTQNPSIAGVTTAASGVYTVTATVGACTSTSTVNVTINPQPTANVPANITQCAGTTIPASAYTSTPAGATFTWTNSNTAIGLGASGAGNTPAFTATNATGAAITSTITVTPTLAGCVGTPNTYTITVNPLPTATVPANITQCPGTTVAASAFTSTPAGATFSWTNSNTAIGLGASGTGNTPAFTATNATGAAITGTITVTPTLSGCTGPNATYTITISPNPTVTVPANITQCAGTTVAASAFTSTPAGATFAWTNSNTAIGLGASGTGNTPAFTATNATGAAITGTITVTPTLAGCTGTPNTYTITVNPLPVTDPVANIAVCDGVNVPASAFTSTPAGATFAWTNSNTSIGLGASGAGNTPAFNATNGGGAPISGTVTVTPTLNGCTGTPATYTITVNSQFDATITPAGPFCANAAPVTLSAVDAGGTWSGTGITNATTGTFDPAVAGAGTWTITYTIPGSCGNTDTENIIVNPVPVVNPIANITVCEGTNIPASAYTSTPAGATFTWTNSNTSIGLGASGAGNTPAFTSTNGTGTAIISVVSVTPTLAGCVGTPVNYDITVNPVFDATVTPAGPFCESDPAITMTAVDAGGTWSGNGITNTTTGAFDPATAGVGTHTITYMISTVCGDTSSVNVQILQDMNATITPVGPFCDNDPAINLTAVDAGGTWSGNGITDAVNGTFDPATAGQGTHTITYTIPGQCGDTQTTTITINTDMDATINPAGPFCASNPNTFLAAVTTGGVWSGPGIVNTSTGEFSPTAAGAGNHVITYMLTGSCGDTSTVTIQVIADADATINPAGPFCITDPALNLSAAQTGGVWSGTGITSAANGTFNPSVAGPGTHTITYSISGVCGDVDTENIIVTDTIPSTITPAGPFCVNASPVTLTAANPGGTWSGNGITNPATGAFDPAAAGVGTHTITYTIPGSCGTTSTTTITVDPLPVVTFNGDVLSGCVPVTTTFTNTTAGTGSATWFVDGVNMSNSTTTFTNVFNTPGCFDITLQVTSAAGCTNTATQADMVCAFAYPVADFSFTPVDATVLNPTINFINESQGATSYVWDFAGLGTSTTVNPSFTFPNTGAGSYQVCLEASNAQGCVDSTCEFVLIYDEFLIYVPNAFTVDGDGLNEVFLPIVSGHDPLSYELMIFNRWGELIFESHFNEVGWDGTHKGMISKQDVYVWKLKVKKASNGEQKEFYGHVSLLRGK